MPATVAGFVKHLQERLTTTAKRVDAALPSSGPVVINDKGEPVIQDHWPALLLVALSIKAGTISAAPTATTARVV